MDDAPPEKKMGLSDKIRVCLSSYPTNILQILIFGKQKKKIAENSSVCDFRFLSGFLVLVAGRKETFAAIMLVWGTWDF